MVGRACIEESEKEGSSRLWYFDTLLDKAQIETKLQDFGFVSVSENLFIYKGPETRRREFCAKLSDLSSIVHFSFRDAACKARGGRRRAAGVCLHGSSQAATSSSSSGPPQ